MQWRLMNGAREEQLGFLPMFVHEEHPGTAKEQFDRNYQHGGGWRPFEGFKFDHNTVTIKYPGDPAMSPIAHAQLRDEHIYVYPYSWVLILQPDASFAVCRMD